MKWSPITAQYINRHGFGLPVYECLEITYFKLSLTAFTIQLQLIKVCVFQIYGMPHSFKISCTNFNPVHSN